MNKLDRCTCSAKYKNRSGHHPDCIVHKDFLDEKKKAVLKWKHEEHEDIYIAEGCNYCFIIDRNNIAKKWTIKMIPLGSDCDDLITAQTFAQILNIEMIKYKDRYKNKEKSNDR